MLTWKVCKKTVNLLFLGKIFSVLAVLKGRITKIIGLNIDLRVKIDKMVKRLV